MSTEPFFRHGPEARPVSKTRAGLARTRVWYPQDTRGPSLFEGVIIIIIIIIIKGSNKGSLLDCGSDHGGATSLCSARRVAGPLVEQEPVDELAVRRAE